MNALKNLNDGSNCQLQPKDWEKFGRSYQRNVNLHWNCEKTENNFSFSVFANDQAGIANAKKEFTMTIPIKGLENGDQQYGFRAFQLEIDNHQEIGSFSAETVSRCHVLSSWSEWEIQTRNI